VRFTELLRDSGPLLLRALSLFGPGELRAVRVIHPKCFDLIVSELDGSGSLKAARLAEALGSLRAVAWFGSGKNLECAFDFIERYGAALIELDGNFWAHDDAADRALASCARLESLTNAQYYDAKVWLGLTNLHTLRGVDLSVASAAAIAAALPRLHTLAAFINASDDHPVAHEAVAGFFEDLVPRLRVLRYHGPWPPATDQAPVTIVPRPLPLLQELIFCCFSDPSVARGFMGAQPVMLHVPHAAAVSMAGEATHRPLARVRELCLALGGRSDALDSSDVGRLLRAAPQVRKFTVRRLRGRMEWLNDPAFTGLVHPWLRSIRVNVASNASYLPSVGCVVQLRRFHFPRLRQLIVNSVQHLMGEE
jgi:hypothetical protein